MDDRIAPLWNVVFLCCVAFCVALWLKLAANGSASASSSVSAGSSASSSPSSSSTRSSGRRRSLFTALVVLTVALGGSQALALSGVLDGWERFPPPAMRIFFPIIALSLYLGLGPLGRFLVCTAAPVWLVGAQVFRLPLELALHGFYEGGAIPVQMSFAGRNLDILSGLLAIPVALLMARGRAGPRVVLAYNALGLALLLNIVGVALLSMPTPLRAFDGLPNTLVVQPYYIWLPVVLVQTALLLHLASIRGAWAALRGSTAGAPPVPAAAGR